MIVDIYTAGGLGLNVDTPPLELDPEFFSYCRNVRFQDGKLTNIRGDTAVYDPPTIDPYFTMYVESSTANLWAYLGLAKAYTTVGGTHFNITRQVAAVDVNYTGGVANRWSGVSVGDVVGFTNGVDVPQMWVSPATGTRLANLSNWTGTDACRILRNFGPYWLALGYITGGVLYSRRLRWSHPADPGSPPPSWDIADDTKDAGQRDIGSSAHGPLTDALMLDKVCMLYQREAIYQMRLVGGTTIFDTSKPMSLETGAIAQDCVHSFNQGLFHFVAGPQDVVLVGLDGVKSIADKKFRKWLNNNISSTDFESSFVAENYSEKEIWYCFPSQGATIPNTALVWSFIDGTLSVRDITPSRHGGRGVVVPNTIDDTWDGGLDETWDGGLDVPWDFQFDNALRKSILLATSNKLVQADDGVTFLGVNIEAVAERTDIALIGRDRFGNWKADHRVRKLSTEVWIKASGDPFIVSLGAQEVPEGPITWGPARTFTPSTDAKLDYTVNGRLLAIRFASIGTGIWAIEGWTIRLVPQGEF